MCKDIEFLRVEINKRLRLLHGDENIRVDIGLLYEEPTIGFKRPEDQAPQLLIDVFVKAAG